MTNYRYLGYGVTNSDGVAHLDHDADGERIDHSYTGVGAGEIDVLASLDNPISQGSIVSETFNVLDTYMRDGGVTGDANNDDWLVQSGGSRTVQSDGTIFSADTDSLFAWVNKHGTSHSSISDVTEFSDDLCIETNVVDINGTVRFSIYEAYPSSTRTDSFLGTGKCRILRLGDRVLTFRNDELIMVTPFTLTEPNRVGVVTSQGNSIKLKNTLVYPTSEEYTGSYVYYDKIAVDTNSVYTKLNATLEFDTDKLVLTRTADGECFAQFAPDVKDYKGKTIKFECDVDSPVNSHIRIYQQVGGSYSSVTSNYGTTGTFTATSEINANATSILFRVMGNNLNSNQGLSFKNIKISSI